MTMTRADVLLSRLQEQDQARLRIYIGAAPGVGKTYAMLREAHLLRSRGQDGLGATVVRVTADTPSDGLIAFAQREGVTHVVFGQTARTRWELFWKGSTLNRFLSAVPDAAVQVIPFGSESGGPLTGG